MLTALVPRLTGVHPDDAFSCIPYEKGSSLLFYLETLLGGPGLYNYNWNGNWEGGGVGALIYTPYIMVYKAVILLLVIGKSWGEWET